MKYYLKSIGILIAFALLTACAKDKELLPADNVNITPGTTGSGGTGFDVSGQTLISQGTFKNGVHPTSGTTKLYRKETTYTLVFDSFKTDAGPDLRVYLAEDNNAKNFIQLTELKNTGNFYLTLPSDADAAKRKNVLIWCKQFSVLFGAAELTEPAKM